MGDDKRACTCAMREASRKRKRMLTHNIALTLLFDCVCWQIFPQHSQCIDCDGHTLPDMSTKILRELKYPPDLTALNLEAKKWFCRIDRDGGGSLNAHEVRNEFQRLGIDHHEVDAIMKFAVSESAQSSSSGIQQRFAAGLRYAQSSFLSSETEDEAELNCGQFITVLQYILDHTIEHFTAADICALNYQLHEYDEDGDGRMDLSEFMSLSLDLVASSFVFNGPQSLNTMHLEQLDALRTHAWKSRAFEDVKEGKNVTDNAQNVFDAQKELLDVDVASATKEQPTFVPAYTLKLKQKKELQSICKSIQSICEKHCTNSDLCNQAKDLFDEETQDLCHTAFDVAGRTNFDSNITHVIFKLKKHIQEDIRKQWTSEPTPKSFPTLESAFRNSEVLISISVQEELLRDIFKDQIMDIAMRLRKEGVVAEPPLEWDGSLGPEEAKVINRLGFLLNAYTVQAYYWELV